jgi:hypothetical protein
MMRRAVAERAGGLDELHLLHRHDLAADDAGHRQPLDGADGDEEQDDVPAEEHHEQDHENRERQRVDDVHHAHHDGVGLAAEEAGDRAVDDADGQRDERGARPTPIEMRPP